MQENFKRDLGVFSTVAIIISQMIGTGVFMAPQGLAELANPGIALLSVTITGAGTLFLALSFAKLDKKGATTGSAIVYTQKAFGDLPAFWVGWSYWCGCWIANGAIILAGLNYASYFFPAFGGNTLPRFLACITVIWCYTIINIRGVKAAGRVNLVLTIIKIIPLLIFAVVAVAHFDVSNFETASTGHRSGIEALPAGVAYMLWSFLGFEGASVNANEVKDPKKIGRLTVISTLIVGLLYLSLITLAFGNMPQDSLAVSTSPLADIVFNATGGYWASALISLGASISAIGCIGAWILSAGRISYSLGKMKLMPDLFAKLHPKYGTPINGLLINGTLMSSVMFLGYITNEGNLYNFLILLSVIVFLVFYLFGAASEIMLAGKEIKPFNLVNFIKSSFISLIALIYAVYTVAGAGATYVFYGFLLMLIGIPVYIFIKLKQA